MDDDALLFSRFLRAPTRVATLTSSSEALVAEMLRHFPTVENPVILELGPGTGRVTEAIQRRLNGRGRHIVIEIDPVLAERLQARHPGVEVVCADAGELPAVLERCGVDRVDLVSSLLPWKAHKDSPIPEFIAKVLAPDGSFAQVALSPFLWMAPARRLERDTQAAFAEVRLGPTVWRNIPPARVRVARHAPV